MSQLSIIIVNYNTIGLTDRCLTTVFSADPQLDVDVIVVDNASTDGSAGRIRADHPAVTIIANSTNRGFAAACNQGLARSQGRYLLLLNSDTEVRPGALSVLVDFMERTPRCGAAGPRIVDGNGQPQISFEYFPRATTYLLCDLPLMARWLAARSRDVTGANVNKPIAIDYPAGACFMVRREVYEKVGGLDERFYSYFEDADWGRRIKLAGWRAYFVPLAKVVHLGGKSWESDDVLKLYYSYDSRYKYFLKHSGEWTALALRLSCLVSQAVKLVFLALASLLLPRLRPRLQACLRILAVNYDLIVA